MPKYKLKLDIAGGQLKKGSTAELTAEYGDTLVATGSAEKIGEPDQVDRAPAGGNFATLKPDENKSK